MILIRTVKYTVMPNFNDISVFNIKLRTNFPVKNLQSDET